MLLKSVMRGVLIAQLVASFLMPVHAQEKSSVQSASTQVPQELTKRTLTRSAETPLEARTFLTKNQFKKVTENVPYTELEPYEAQETYYVNVPYQEQETYYEQIPYQTEETYYVDVPYQETETYTEQVPYTERVSYQDTETYYENEYKCRSVTKYRNECRNETNYRNECRREESCHIVPGDSGREECRNVEECGINERGERQCRSRRVCERTGSSGSRRECRQVEKCDRVPYENRVCRDVPYTDNECGYESVPKTRSVTRYRDETRYRNETRTRTVTKYRSEARTRTVTKYREEARTRTVTKYREEARTRTVTKYKEVTKCCRPELVDKFDKQLTFNVKIKFPENSQLIDQEKETLLLSLVEVKDDGGVKKPVMTLESEKTIFKYEVIKQEWVNDEMIIEVKASPKLTAGEVGQKTVDLSLARSSDQAMKVQIVDQVTSARFQSQYRLIVTKAEDEEVVFDQVLEALQVNVPLDPMFAYKVQLSVLRESALLVEGRAEFTVSKVFEKQVLSAEELVILKDRFQIQIQNIAIQLAQTQFQVTDATREFDEVITSYRVIINQYQGSKIQRLSEKTWFRKDLPEHIQLAMILNSKQLTQMKRGMKLQIHVIAKRKITINGTQQEVSLERSKDVSL